MNRLERERLRLADVAKMCVRVAKIHRCAIAARATLKVFDAKRLDREDRDTWEDMMRTAAKLRNHMRRLARIQQVRAMPLLTCAADRDGECCHRQCPQIRDGEPYKSGRHCPIDNREDY